MAKFNHTLHKELWNWLAENPEMDKIDWSGWDKYGLRDEIGYINISYACFACQYVEEHSGKEDMINEDCRKYCPLQWKVTYYCGVSYMAWENLRVEYENGQITLEKFRAERSKLARKIRDLKVKNGVEYK